MAYFKNIDRFGNEIVNEIPLDFNPVPVGFTPTASGNTTNKNSFVIDPNGDMYFIDKDGDSFKINTSNPLDVLTSVQPTPTATGNTTNLNSVFKDANGDTWIVDYKGDAVKAGSAAAPETVTTVTNALATGNKIGTYTNEAGAVVDIYETVTSVTDFSIAGSTITLKYKDETGTENTKSFNLPAAVSETVTTLTDAIATGHKIGTYTNESGTAVTINETVTSIGTITYDAVTGVLTIPYTDEAGVLNNKTVTLPVANAFKNLNEFHVDPNGNDTTGTGAQEKPYLTITKALTQAAQGDQVVVHAGVYAENITLSTQNVALVGAQSEYGALSQINGSVTVTASGTSVKIADIGVNSIVHSGSAPLYLENATVYTTFNSSSSAYVEISNSSIQDGDITKSAGIILIEESKIDNVNITGANTVGSIRNSYQDLNSTITYGAGTVYNVQNVQGGEVVINASAIPLETVALAQGVTAEMAKEAETADFMKLGMLRPDTEAAPTKYVTWDEVTGRLEVSPAPTTGGASANWMSATTDPTLTGNTGTLPRFQWNTTNDSKWYVDANGVALLIEGAATGCGTVYFNNVDPSTATIFDSANPPITNNDALKNLDCAVYIGTDGSVWTSDGTTYKTKTYSFPLHQRDVITATAGQTSFTLTKTPIGGTGKLVVSRNGVVISDAFTVVGNLATYNPANNYSCTIDANDKLIFSYEAN